MKKIICFTLMALTLTSSIIPMVAQSEETGDGTFKAPFALHYLADSGALISVRVTGLLRPADAGEDMMPPNENEEYVSVSVDVECAEQRSENCFIGAYDFTLSGDNGILYETTGLEYTLEPGAATSIDWLFLISSDDSNLLMHYYNHLSMPFAYPQVFATEAQDETTESLTIEVIPTIGMIARVGPHIDLDFTGVAHRGELALAHGRNEDGSWLEIGIGWIPTRLVEAESDIMRLPITAR